MYGAKIREDFIAERTIKNRYRKMTGVWCEAFDKIVDGRTMQDWTDFARASMLGSSSELSVDIHKEVVKRLWIENTRLRAAQKKESDSGSGPEPMLGNAPTENLGDREPIDLDAIREWVLSVGQPQSRLSSTEVGLKLNDNVRSGMIVMDFDTFEALKGLTGVTT